MRYLSARIVPVANLAPSDDSGEWLRTRSAPVERMAVALDVASSSSPHLGHLSASWGTLFLHEGQAFIRLMDTAGHAGELPPVITTQSASCLVRWLKISRISI